MIEMTDWMNSSNIHTYLKYTYSLYDTSIGFESRYTSVFNFLENSELCHSLISYWFPAKLFDERFHCSQNPVSAQAFKNMLSEVSVWIIIDFEIRNILAFEIASNKHDILVFSPKRRFFHKNIEILQTRWHKEAVKHWMNS